MRHRPVRPDWRRVMGPLLLLAALGCSRESWNRAPSLDDVMARMSWFSSMYRGVALEPYELPRAPAAGSVPITGTEPELRVEFEESLPLVNRLRNPVPRTSESLDRGRVVFDIYCYPCHGPAGAGDGPVTPMFIQPPDLTAQRAREFSDGYLYTVIRQGRGIMPMYGDKIRVPDRWHLVNYLRALQEESGQ